MNKQLLLLCLGLFGFQLGNAQPPICGPNAVMGTTCQAACIICDINGFSGNNPGNTGGIPPPGYCTAVVHSAEWLGFIAGSTNLTLEFAVSNCTAGGGNGLEAAIYEGIDCQNFMLVSNCETAIFNNTSVFISNTIPLTIGQYYWLVVDSNGGNACDYDITVTAGSTQVPPLSSTGPILGDLTACPGATIDYQTTTVFGGSDYDWTLNGVPVASGQNVGITYPSAGIYNLCVQASNACSMAAPTCVSVNVMPIPPSDHFETICLGDCVTVGNLTLCAPGVFPIIFTSYQGCDSLVNVNITAIPASVTVLEEEICEGESIIINTEEFEETGVFNVALLGYEGCDSNIVLNLNVLPNPETYLIEEICEGESFEVGAESFFVTGNFEVPFVSSESCDSIVYLDLTILPIQESYLNEEICDGDIYQIGNEIFSSSGIYQIPFLNENGCDSLVNLDLTVLIIPETYLEEEICEGASYELGNDLFFETGNYQVIISDQHGCDSLVNLELTVLPSLLTNLEEQICDGAIFSVGNEDFDQSGVYEVTLTGTNGCDSLVELVLEVTALLEINLKESICEGDNFMIGSEIFDSTGVFEVMLVATSGCDSLVQLDLEVLQFLETDLTENICEGESFSIGNEIFDTTGIYEVTFISVSGCDSIVTLDLTTLAIPEVQLSASICQGDSVRIGNQYFKEPGQFEMVMSTVFGCDSLVYLDLTVYSSPAATLSPSICDGDTYFVGPYPFNETGQDTVFLNTVNGCDSVIYLNLEVITFFETQLIEQICEGENFQVGTEQFEENGNYEVILPTASGCDSIVNLDLTVYSLPETYLVEQICEGEDFLVGTEIFKENGDFKVILLNQNNCDSTVFLNLTVIPSNQTFLTESLCQGEIIQVGTEVFDQNGQYNITLSAVTGCDSLVNLDLTIIPPQLEFLNKSICEGESFTVGNEMFTESGLYNVNLEATSGCDSLVNLNLTVLDFLETNLDEAICEGESYIVGTEIFDSEGEYVVNLVADSGCDSIVTLDLKINLAPETFLTEILCEGEIMQVGVEIFDETGQYQIPLFTTFGCDSLVYLDLEIIPNEQTFLDESICETESYTVGNEVFNQTGQYQVLLISTEGCDSLVDLDLVVIALEQTLLQEEICEGESFMVGTEVFNQTGQYQVILTGISGCDSIVDLDLNVETCAIFGNIIDDELLCAGDSDGILNFSIQGGANPYVFSWDQVSGILSGSGIISDLNGSYSLENLPVGYYSITITDNNGISEILLGQIIQPDWLEISLEFSDYGNYNISCNGGQDGYVTALYDGGTAPYDLQWSNGVSNPLELAAGQYDLTITDANGCTLVESFALTQPAPLNFEFETEDPQCQPQNSGSITIQNPAGGVPDYLLDLSGGGFGQNFEFANLPPGDYEITLQDANGCEIIESINLLQPPGFQIELGDDLTINLGDSIQLIPSFSAPTNVFLWQNNPGLSCYDCPNPFAQPFQNTVYYLNATTEKGCEATDEITIFVNKSRNVYIPNAFSPNGDALNDVFMVFGGSEVSKVHSLQIFSRWGEPVFQIEDFQPNDPDYGWNGTYRGEKMQPAVFVWFAEIEFLDGERIIFEGDVVLMR
ncbi:MAG: gliding motility-associated C-terminal domain-containing protein [Bacteroidetes bacterium]|nr:gliding motility-associated C-terminal domain-containing protein [Bacteroidota bacterium]